MNDIIFFFFYNLAHKSVIFDNIVIFLAVYFPFLILFTICVFILYQSKIYYKNNLTRATIKELMRKLIIIIGPAFVAYLIATGLKEIIHLERSFVQLDEVSPLFNPNQKYSFPSTHATIFSALAFSLDFSNLSLEQKQ